MKILWGLGLAAMMIVWYGPHTIPDETVHGLNILESGAKDHGFSHADPDHIIQLPTDHGPHKNFQTEWWYLVMHLSDSKGQRYAAQWTVFRQAMPQLHQSATSGVPSAVASDSVPPQPSDVTQQSETQSATEAQPWQYDHHYLGHLSWLPPSATASTSQHINLRGSPHLAGSNPSKVWCGPMRLSGLDDKHCVEMPAAPVIWSCPYAHQTSYPPWREWPQQRRPRSSFSLLFLHPHASYGDMAHQIPRSNSTVLPGLTMSGLAAA